ncbi:MAG: S-ribosylhomocysteine lyase [Oscillospiraceae bacterium]|jgi:S-ribosylhomocysteine lyase|nr:S-ribosylhomocysteine lyase [Oscillospiraceae bacterium]
MERIASFDIDHCRLEPGMYISSINDDIVTYDLRFVRPNTPPFLESGAIHTIEHLFATYVRNSRFKNNVVYFGPMGCRTGFYFILRSVSHADAIALTKETLSFISAYDDEIPGVSATECGNYLDHDLKTARVHASYLRHILENWNESLLNYKR